MKRPTRFPQTSDPPIYRLKVQRANYRIIAPVPLTVQQHSIFQKLSFLKETEITSL